MTSKEEGTKMLRGGARPITETHPDLMLEWDTEKNEALGIHPEDYSAGSGAKAWWACHICGHKWQAAIKSRTSGRGCPACRGKRISTSKSVVPEGESLADRFPGLAAEWSERNALGPESYRPGSNKPVWWACSECGHEWQAPPNRRTGKGSGCPKCRDRRHAEEMRAPVDGESLADAYPELVAEWSKRNALPPSSYRHHSNESVWWLCPSCGYEWQAVIANRANGKGCPRCGVQAVGESNATPPAGKSLADTNPELTAEWDPENEHGPERYFPGSNKAVGWVCPRCHRRYRAVIANRTLQKSGCPWCKFSHGERATQLALEALGVPYVPQYRNEGCRYRNVLAFDFAVVAPDDEDTALACIEYQGVQHYDGVAFFGGNRQLKTQRAIDATKARWCAEQGIPLLEIPYTAPDDDVPSIVEAFLEDNELNHLFSVRSYEEYRLLEQERAHKEKRSRKTLFAGRPPLSQTHPEVAAYWDYDNNDGKAPDDYSSGSSHKAKWLCPKCGYRWTKDIKAQVRSGTCPHCDGTRPMRGVDDFATVHPQLASEWSTHNKRGPDYYLASTRVSVLWVCPECGNEWRDKASNRVLYGHRCPSCHPA